MPVQQTICSYEDDHGETNSLHAIHEPILS